MRFTLNSLARSKYALTFIGVILALALLFLATSNTGPAAAQTGETPTPTPEAEQPEPADEEPREPAAQESIDAIRSNLSHSGSAAERRVTFVSERDGNPEIYVMDSDGINQTRLTNNSAQDFEPSWSPDGSRIAFSANRNGNHEVYVMDADGSNQTRLTNYSKHAWEPSWSPDGSRIAFSGNSEIYIMNADGSNQTRLTHNSDDDGAPSWSPDGSRIVFHSLRSGNWQIYVMNADGSSQTRLTHTGNFNAWPAWSPDGSRITFESRRDGNYEIYVMNADGSSQTRLTNNSAGDQRPTYSPDGSHIAFQTQRDGNYELYVMNADGSSQTRLTNNSSNDYGPNWASAGSATPTPTPTPTHTSTPTATLSLSGRIAFTSSRNDDLDIHVMNADGTDITRLTDDVAYDWNPSWSPDGSRIAFNSITGPRANNNWDVYVMDADGDNIDRLTNNSSKDYDPSWSPDGEKIAFTSNRNGDTDIYVRNADGTGGATRLTQNAASDWSPSWSPDGSRIAFISDRAGNDEVYVMNADGSGQTRLTSDSAVDWEPSWSPDGSRIAFSSSRYQSNRNIFVMNANGTGVTRLTDNRSDDDAPSWSPDGQYIAFTSRRGGNQDIYLVSTDGTKVETRLTNHSGDDYGPSWNSAGGSAPSQLSFRMSVDASHSNASITRIEADKTFDLTVRMYDVTARGEHGGISVSFPQLNSDDNRTSSPYYSSVADVAVKTNGTTVSNVSFYRPGDDIYRASDNARISARHLLVESDNHSWAQGSGRTLKLQVTPKRPGEFKILVRGWICEDEYTDCSRKPDSGVRDQQGWRAQELTVTVEVPPTLAPTSDRAALVELYKATNGDNWKYNTNWLSDKPLGEWDGVTTNSDGRVIELWLGGNQLTGAIPPDLGNLSNLEWLLLYDNQLTGSIPDALGNLSNLEFLILYDNRLTDPLPQSFTSLTALTYFAFDGNAGLCAPTDAAFQNWLQGVANSSGPNCDDTPALEPAEKLAHMYAPILRMHPEERFFPKGVEALVSVAELYYYDEDLDEQPKRVLERGQVDADKLGPVDLDRLKSHLSSDAQSQYDGANWYLDVPNDINDEPRTKISAEGVCSYPRSGQIVR